MQLSKNLPVSVYFCYCNTSFYVFVTLTDLLDQSRSLPMGNSLHILLLGFLFLLHFPDIQFIFNFPVRSKERECSDAHSLYCWEKSASESRDWLNPQQMILLKTGRRKDWTSELRHTNMLKLLMKAVLGSSTSNEISWETSAWFMATEVMTVWAKRDVTVQSIATLCTSTCNMNNKYLNTDNDHGKCHLKHYCEPRLNGLH